MARQGKQPSGGRKRTPQPLVSKRARRAQSRKPVAEEEVQTRSSAARNPFVIIGNMIILLLVMGVIALGAILAIGREAYLASGPLNDDVGVVINPGAGLQAIARELEEQGVITNQYVFMAAAYLSGAAERLQAGEYEIPARASMATVVDQIVSGSVVQHVVTIPEGFSSIQAVRRLEANEVLLGTIEEIPAEGSILPETYQFTRGTTRQRMIDIMQAAMQRTVEEVWANRAPDLPISSPRELVILASIVEKETGLSGERARVAAVFVNRLRQNMRLETDPTILYGLYGGEAWARPRGGITQAEKSRPNRYNTYQISGLPPGPIANPGRAALEAVANPDSTNELFFVADGTGGHRFAATYPEHQRNVALWREFERQRAAARTE